MSNQIPSLQQNHALDPVLQREVETLIRSIYKNLQEKSNQKGYELTKSERLADRIATFSEKLLSSTEKPSIENLQYIQGTAKDLIQYAIECNISDKRKEALSSILAIANNIVPNKSDTSELSKTLPFVKALLVITNESDHNQKMILTNSEKRTFELDPRYHNAYKHLEARFEVLSNTKQQVDALAKEPSLENEEKAKLAIQALYRLYQETEQQSMGIIGGLLSAGKGYFWSIAPWELEELQKNTLQHLQKLCPGWEAGKYKIMDASAPEETTAPEEWSDEEYGALQKYVELEDLVLTYKKNPTEKNKKEIDQCLDGLEVIFEEDDLQLSQDSQGRKIIHELMKLEGQQFLDKWYEVFQKLQEICTPAELEETKSTSQKQLKNLKDIKDLVDLLEKASQIKVISDTCQERMVEMFRILRNENSNKEILDLFEYIFNAEESDFWETCKTICQLLEPLEKNLRIPNLIVALPKKQTTPTTKEVPKNEIGQDRLKTLNTSLKLIENILINHHAPDSLIGELVELYSLNDEGDLLKYLLNSIENDSEFGKHIKTHMGTLQEMTQILISSKSPSPQKPSTQTPQIKSEEKESKRRKPNSEDEWDVLSE